MSEQGRSALMRAKKDKQSKVQSELLKVLTLEELNMVWQALYGKRCDCSLGNDIEKRDKYNALLDKIGIPAD